MAAKTKPTDKQLKYVQDLSARVGREKYAKALKKAAGDADWANGVTAANLSRQAVSRLIDALIKEQA